MSVRKVPVPPSRFRVFMLLVLMFALTGCNLPLQRAGMSSQGPWFVDPAGSDANDCLTPSTACLTIQKAVDKTASGGTVHIAAGTYLGSVIVQKDLTLQGPGASAAAIDGVGTRRPLEVVNSTVEVRDIALKGGFTDLAGGCLFNDGGTVTLNGVLIEGCEANRGGGAFNSGQLAVDNSEFKENLAREEANSLYNAQGGIASISNSTIHAHNIPNADDYAQTTIRNQGGLTIEDTSVADNNHHGILNMDGKLTLENTEVVSNEGNAITSTKSAEDNVSVSVTIFDSEIDNNGGTGVMAESSRLIIDNTQISNNLRGVFADNSVVDLQNVTVIENENMGGIDVDSSDLTIINSTINRNHHVDGHGGGVNFGPNVAELDAEFNPILRSLHIRDSTISANSSGDNPPQTLPISEYAGGGGIYITSGDVDIINTTINSNKANFGGGLATKFLSPVYRGDIHVEGATINENEATAPEHVDFGDMPLGGGGLFIVDAQSTIEETLIENNLSSNAGGGIQVASARDTVQMQDVELLDNTSPRGGGIYADLFGGYEGGGLGTASMTITGSHIEGNTANGECCKPETAGGGIFSGLDELTIRETTISNNTSAAYGGGIAFANHFVLINSTVSGNQADYGGGIVLAANRSQSFSFNFVTIYGNEGLVTGGGIHRINLPSTQGSQITNSILAGNASTEPGHENCSNLINTTGSHIVEDLNTCGFGSGSSMPNMDPLLEPLADTGGSTLTHALASGSPAIDAAEQASCPAVDQRGVSRPQGQGCDIGAVEMEALGAAAVTASPVRPTSTTSLAPTKTPTPSLTPHPPTDTPTPEPNGTVSGILFRDENGDGIWQGGESRLEDVDLTLRAGTCSGSVAAQRTTGSQGAYAMGGIAAGDYCLEVDETTLPASVDAWTPSTDNPLNLSFSPGEDKTGVNFGFIPVTN